MNLLLVNKKLTATDVHNLIANFTFNDIDPLFNNKKTELEYFELNSSKIPKFINEFWTSKQRQNNPIHEVS